MEVRSGHHVPEGRLKSWASNPRSSLLDTEDSSLTIQHLDMMEAEFSKPRSYSYSPVDYILISHGMERDSWSKETYVVSGRELPLEALSLGNCDDLFE